METTAGFTLSTTFVIDGRLYSSGDVVADEVDVGVGVDMGDVPELQPAMASDIITSITANAVFILDIVEVLFFYDWDIIACF